MPQYFYYQGAGGEDKWVEALAEHRDLITAKHKPAFVTVLDLDRVVDSTMTREDFAKLRYAGPLYFDFDANSDVSDTIPKFHEFLENLKEKGVNLECLRIYATGGRGFHVEVPPQVFMVKVPRDGTRGLPYIFRDMAMDMVVDTMDMKIYSGRRGRMWRTCGVERISKETDKPNGKYKVPLTLDEALAITKESYEAVTNAPRSEPTRAEPELSTYLATLFVKCQQKVETAVGKAGKANKDSEVLAKFNHQWPPTVEKLLKGEGLAPGVGFQSIALQLAIVANALGKDLEAFIKDSADLCKNHQGDSSRYGSPRKRREELERMWEYTHDNPCYTYSRGGIKSITAVDVSTNDLDGPGLSGIGQLIETPLEEMTKEEQADMEMSDRSLFEGISINRGGIYRKAADDNRKVSNVGFVGPIVLREATPDGSGHHVQLGIVCDILSDDNPCGRHVISDKVFLSRVGLTTYMAAYSGIYSGTDTQAGAVKLTLSRAAQKDGNVVYAVHKEGLDLVQNPKYDEEIKRDVIWSTPDRVVTHSDAVYTYQPQMSTSAFFNPDVHKGNPIVNTPDTLEWMKNLLRINAPATVAQMLGWFVSTFHKQFYQEAFHQFPLLHPTGPAGSGKSQTTLLMGRLNYLTAEPKMVSCGTVTTQFSLKVALTGSSSVPLILDEYKPSEMGLVRTDFLMQAFRLAYNQGKGASGAMGNSSAQSTFRDISEYTFSSPICFLAEAQEMQTAIAQRTLAVPFSNSESSKHRVEWFRTLEGKHHMPELGKLLLLASFNETVESRRDALTPLIATLRSQFMDNVHDRQVFNLAIVLEGLNFLEKSLEPVFGTELKDDIQTLRKAIYDHKEEISSAALSEAAKMFKDMSLMSRNEPSDSPFAMREGYEYIVKDGYMEMLMRETFVKYYSWARNKGFPPYYASPESFMKAMAVFPPTIDKICVNSPLRTSGVSRIFRFSLEKLLAEGVETFQTK